MSTNETQTAPSRASTSSFQEDDVTKPQPPPVRQQYIYTTQKKANPNAQPKTQSKLSAFLSKFRSPAVKATTAIRDREDLEAERTGVVKNRVMDTGRSSNAWALSGGAGGPGN
ncbi:hypothetical protein OQA88_6006 [Cercophora sp. LCS_1]